MSITKIGSDQAVFNLSQTTNAIDPLTRKSNPGRKINSLKEGSSKRVHVSQSQSVFNSLQAVNSSLNMVAMGIRIADMTMETMETYIDQMKPQLERIIKNYPPFAPGSEERVKFLRAFSALRRQIDQLSFAPDYKQDLKITADSMNIPRAGDWNVVIGGNGPRVTIHSQQVHTGPTGLNIPELPESATDKEISAAIRNLEDAKETLGKRRSGLATDALSIQQFLESNPKIDEFAGSSVEAPKSPDIAEINLENKSSEVRQGLTIDSVKSLTKDQSQLLELIK